MSLLRLIFVIVACGMALAHNVDRMNEQKLVESSFDSEIYPQQSKSVHRRESPAEIVADHLVGDTGALSPDKISDIHHDTGSLDKNKRSLNVQPEHVAEPGCCG